jgi:hypothetical protein
MKKTLLLLASLALLGACGGGKSPADPASTDAESSSISLESTGSSESETPMVSSSGESISMAKHYSATLAGKAYALSLEGSDTAKAFAALLPLTLEMSELNGNEKYHYLDTAIRQDPASVPDGIRAGDLMLFGNSCVVLFYQDFQTSYSYVRLGRLESPEGLANQIGPASVTVAFAAE